MHERCMKNVYVIIGLDHLFTVFGPENVPWVLAVPCGGMASSPWGEPEARPGVDLSDSQWLAAPV